MSDPAKGLPAKAWFELIREDEDAWTCYEVGLEKGDVDGDLYIRADIVEQMVKALRSIREETLGLSPLVDRIRRIAQSGLAAYEEAEP